MFKRGIDIRDIACDGWGFTAEMAGLNRYMAKYLEKVKADIENKSEQPKKERQERQSK